MRKRPSPSLAPDLAAPESVTPPDPVSADADFVEPADPAPVFRDPREEIATGLAEAALSTRDPTLLVRLRAWRRERARAEQVPPYVVMPNAVLTELSAARPADLEDLGAVRGMGAIRRLRYGEEVLRLIRDASVPEAPPAAVSETDVWLAGTGPDRSPPPATPETDTRSTVTEPDLSPPPADGPPSGGAACPAPLAPTPFTVAIEYRLSDRLRQRLVDELGTCVGQTVCSLRKVLQTSPARLTLRLDVGGAGRRRGHE